MGVGFRAEGSIGGEIVYESDMKSVLIGFHCHVGPISLEQAMWVKHYGRSIGLKILLYRAPRIVWYDHHVTLTRLSLSGWLCKNLLNMGSLHLKDESDIYLQV